MTKKQKKLEELLVSCVRDAKVLFDSNREAWDEEIGVVSNSEFNQYLFKLNGILHTLQIFIDITEAYINDILGSLISMLHALDDEDEEVAVEIEDWLYREFHQIAKKFKG